jgi:ribonuclease T1
MMSGTVRRTAWTLLALALIAATTTVVLLRSLDRPAVEPAGSPAARSVTGYDGTAPPTATAGDPRPQQPQRKAADGAAESPALDRARQMLAAIEERGGEPLPGHVGGREFHNRERRLPPGRYREYDVHPRVRGKDRGPERLVVDRTTGRAYYTGDHYRTFVPLR